MPCIPKHALENHLLTDNLHSVIHLYGLGVSRRHTQKVLSTPFRATVLKREWHVSKKKNTNMSSARNSQCYN